MNILEETKFIMNKYDVKPNKKLGQNFLIDEEAINFIADLANEEDTIIEIGPGLGTLTSKLLERAKKVIVIELDSKMVDIIKDRFKLYKNIEIIQGDILKIDISKYKNAKIIANLPYYITTEIITKLIKQDINEINVLIQKEVAERICAMPGEKEAGAITYFVQYYADAKILKQVTKECFIPSPKVDSTVIQIKKLEKPRVQVKNEDLLFELIKENFSKRRKTITNSLSNTVPKEKLINILKELGIDENIRGEKLSLEQFAQMSNLIQKIYKISQRKH